MYPVFYFLRDDCFLIPDHIRLVFNSSRTTAVFLLLSSKQLVIIPPETGHKFISLQAMFFFILS